MFLLVAVTRKFRLPFYFFDITAMKYTLKKSHSTRRIKKDSRTGLRVKREEGIDICPNQPDLDSISSMGPHVKVEQANVDVESYSQSPLVTFEYINTEG